MKKVASRKNRKGSAAKLLGVIGRGEGKEKELLCLKWPWQEEEDLKGRRILPSSVPCPFF